MSGAWPAGATSFSLFWSHCTKTLTGKRGEGRVKEAIKRQKSDFVGNCVKKTCETCFQTRRTERLNRDEMLQVFDFLFILYLYELNISTQSVYHTTVSSFFPILLGFFPILCFSSRACSSSWNEVFATKQTETTHLVLILREHCHCTCTVWWVQMRMIEHSLYYSTVKRYFSTLLVDTGDPSNT